MRSAAETLLRISALALALACSAGAHPGTGIVADSRGNVYYTDLSQVWRVAVDGKKTIAVPGVHTHALWIDSLDNLYGEHLWYEGDATGKWGHRVWKRTPDGTVGDVIPSRPGFRDDYDDFHFVRDRAGSMYWADEDSVTVIRKRTAAGVVSELLRKPMRRAGSMTVSREGRVYFVDGDDLVRRSPDGGLRTLARGLAVDEHGGSPPFNRSAIFGLWTDSLENVYLAVADRGCVMKVDTAGTVAVADRSVSPWKPSGGLVAQNGDLWVLEYSVVNAVRVRQVRRDGVTRIF